MHDVDGNLTASGSIYTESLNRKDFMDPNTVIYGHNMKNGTMFRDLHLYQEKEFFDSHPDVYIYLPGKRLTYEIFSAYEYDNRHLLKAFDFSDPEVYAAYLETALQSKGGECDDQGWDQPDGSGPDYYSEHLHWPGHFQVSGAGGPSAGGASA